jgi:translation initiation factor 1
MTDQNKRLVYSTSAKTMETNRKKSFQNIDPNKTTLRLRLETKGRGGKSVTVLYELANNPDYWTALLKKIKAHCACGGTYLADSSTIEVQGDHRTKLKPFLEKMGFKVLGAY